MPTVADVIHALDELYDPALAEPWDAIGLVCGAPEASVRRVLFAVDPVAVVVEEAIRREVDLLVTHHPLYLKGTTSVAATEPKGRLVHRLIAAGIALHVVHTNADAADPGVSDALAGCLGLLDVAPLQPVPAAATDKLVTFVPRANLEALVDALSRAGAGEIGDYRRCAYYADGTGTFIASAGTNPTVGHPGRVETVPEVRLEMPFPRSRRAAVLASLRAAHPYEEPAFDVVERADLPSGRGLGRIGTLPAPVPLARFVATVARALPTTVAGVRATGDPAAPVGVVAVCGGAGGELADRAAGAGADVLVTADLRHHPAGETAERGRPALVDVAHWASEWPWLADAARRLAARVDTVETEVSAIVTDPWTVHEDVKDRSA